MDFKERIEKLNDYSHKVKCITELHKNSMIEALKNSEAEFREFLLIYKAIVGIDNNDALLDILDHSVNAIDSKIHVYKYGDEFVIGLIDSYVIGQDGTLSEINIDDKPSIIHNCTEKIVSSLITSAEGQKRLSEIMDLLDNFAAVRDVVYNSLDAQLEFTDKEYSDYEASISHNSKNFADMFSIDNVAKFADNEDTGLIEETYDESNIPEVIKMRVDINRIPDLKNNRVKSHYEIFFNGILGEGTQITFMVEAVKCIKVTDSIIDVLLDSNDHYTVYKVDHKGSRKKIFTGWELYKLNKEYLTS